MGNIKLFFKLYCAVFLLAAILLLATICKLPEITQNDFDSQSAHLNLEKKDWHDYKAMEQDRKRTGIGEQGEPALIKDKSLKKKIREISLINGYNGLLSDMISVNRSIRDIRHAGCKTLKYLANLPPASIVIPFYNEHFSVLMRSVHSLINRSPPELLREIILVDDASNHKDLQKRLDDYVMENFSIVRIIRLASRTGLIGARLFGARNASADILIFMDAHIEASYNWLPPLLEPIAIDKHTVVCPFIDSIDDVTFEYTHQDEGARGAFNWFFDYKRLPLLPENQKDRTAPFENPVMAGGLFAISAKFFWELGGYDEGLDIWGGEQYELSFKIWMCGGKLLDVPCSRVGHIYRGKLAPEESPRDGDYVRRNFKRVAEVWMDDYKKYLFNRDQTYAKIDAGDLIKQKALRKKLKCKSFKWYMENIAFDLVKIYPLVEPNDYANGAIESIATPSFCIDTMNGGESDRVELFSCAEDIKNPQTNQNWALSAHRDIRSRSYLLCLTVKSSNRNAPVRMKQCLEEGGDQFWYYDFKRQWIVFGRNGDRCLESLPTTTKLVVNKCRRDNIQMRWKFGFVNVTALEQFFDDIPDISYML